MDLKKYERLNEERKLIEVGDRIIIAMSGGPDSVFLYELLKKIRENMKLTIYFAHINHSLRGNDSDSDEDFVKKLGQKEKIETYTKKVDIKKYARDNNISEEEAGREIRYGFFRELKDKVGATKVALAHNEDDVVETFMFRLIRGTSLKGLEGIPVKREFFIRPILSYRKEEILKYLDENSIEYCIDKTNFKDVYTRNKIRLNLIPTIEKEYNKNFKEKIINLISDIRGFNGIINSSLKKYIDSDILDVDTLKKQDEFMRRVIISEYLQKYGISVNRNKILEVQKLIFSDGTKEINVSNGYTIKKTYGEIKVVEKTSQNDAASLEAKLIIPGSVIWKNYKITAKFVEGKNDQIENKKIYFCNFQRGDDLLIRSRMDGDRFYPEKMRGSKKIKDLFIDLKIPKDERDNIPIVTYEGDIVAVGKIRGDRRFKDSKGNKVKLIIEKI